MFNSQKQPSSDTDVSQDSNQDSNKGTFDTKLQLVYHLAMMFLFIAKPIADAMQQVYLALLLLIILVAVSCIHKIQSNWTWPGLSISSLPSLVVGLGFTYAFLAFAAYSMVHGEGFPHLSVENFTTKLVEAWPVIKTAALNPVYTPWFLVGLGIAFMNAMVSLRFATLKQSEFDAQCAKQNR